MRLNLRKINQLIREAWAKGQSAALRGAGKSSCYSWSDQVAREYFPDIDPQAVTRIAQGRARLAWDATKREIVVIDTAIDTSPSSAEPETEENAKPSLRTAFQIRVEGPKRSFDANGHFFSKRVFTSLKRAKEYAPAFAERCCGEGLSDLESVTDTKFVELELDDTGGQA